MQLMMNIEEAQRHAGKQNYMTVERRALDALPKYMWTWKQGKERRGYCTACGNSTRIESGRAVPDWALNDPYADESDSHPETEYGLEGPESYHYWKGRKAFDHSGRHGHYGTCPACGTFVQYRSENIGHSCLVDRVFLIRYAKSAVEEGALVMTGWLAIADWSRYDGMNEQEPELDITLREICVFRPGRGAERFVAIPMFEGETQVNQDGSLSAINIHRMGFEWTRRRKCLSGFDPYAGIFGRSGSRFYLDKYSLDEAIAGTRWETAFQGMVGDEERMYGCLDKIDVFQFIAQWPCVEYLCKLGLGHLAYMTMRHEDEGAINLRGKTAQRVLRVDGNDWGWIKGHPEEATMEFLRCLQLARERKMRISAETIGAACKRSNGSSLRRLLTETEPDRSGQAVKWCMKRGAAFNDYADYLEQLKTLKMDTNDKALLYPTDFRAAHERLSARIRAAEDKKQDEKIRKRTESLGMYWYSAMGLTIRPFLSSAEIIREGEQMHHCVGGYVKRYAEGGTILLCMREDERMNKPYRTLEFSTQGEMVQCRGFRNQSPADEQPRIDEFLRLYGLYRAEYTRMHKRKRLRQGANPLRVCDAG